MAGALGVNQKWLFTSVFALGSLLAALGGSVQIPREPATLAMDLSVISDAFVVVVVGGLGSISGAFLAALLIAEIKAFCIGIGDVTWLGHRVFLFQAHPGGRVHRDGSGAGDPSLGTARPAAEPAAQCGAGRGAACACPRLARCAPWSRSSPRSQSARVLLGVHAGAADRHHGVRAVLGEPVLHHGARAACTPSAMRPTSASVPTVPACWCRAARRWRSACSPGRCWRDSARWCSAGSACACRACTSRC